MLVALSDLTKGLLITFQEKQIELKENIPAKNKMYINDLQTGYEVFMYGLLVGKLTTGVQSEMLMTATNMVHAADPYAYKAVDYQWKAPDQNFIVPHLSCQPCSNYGTKTCPKGHFNCMLQQDIPAIMEAALGYLRG